MRLIVVLLVLGYMPLNAQSNKSGYICGDYIPPKIPSKWTNYYLPHLKDTISLENALRKYFINKAFGKIDWFFISVNFKVSKKGTVQWMQMSGRQPDTVIKEAIDAFMVEYLKKSEWYPPFVKNTNEFAKIEMSINLGRYADSKEVLVTIAPIYTSDTIYNKVFTYD